MIEIDRDKARLDYVQGIRLAIAISERMIQPRTPTTVVTFACCSLLGWILAKLEPDRSRREAYLRQLTDIIRVEAEEAETDIAIKKEQPR